MARRLIVRPCASFKGTIRPPSDKSLTHRAYMFAALARGVARPSVITNPLNGEDCESTLTILQQLGAGVTRVNASRVEISPPAMWNPQPVTLDCGNSGTTMRLLCGLLAGLDGVHVTLTGDHSLSKRPMGRVTEPLRQMGANISGDSAPIMVHGRKLTSVNYKTPVASAQIKSAILLAGLQAEGNTSVTEPELSRDHTERMFTALGVQLQITGNTVSIAGGQTWDPFEFSVPGDISSSTFFVVAALLHADSRVCFKHLGVNPSRTGVLDVLDQMGIYYRIENEPDELGEPVADLTISSVESFRPFEIAGNLVPRLVDEIPVLAVLATQCHGTTVIRDAKELRVKETDRIAVVCQYLSAMGADIRATEDGMIINGPTPLIGTTVDSSGDHRIGMSFAIAGSIATGETIIENADAIETSYPEFSVHFQELSGVELEQVN